MPIQRLLFTIICPEQHLLEMREFEFEIEGFAMGSKKPAQNSLFHIRKMHAH